jgi:hypothetical protein
VRQCVRGDGQEKAEQVRYRDTGGLGVSYNRSCEGAYLCRAFCCNLFVVGLVSVLQEVGTTLKFGVLSEVCAKRLGSASGSRDDFAPTLSSAMPACSTPKVQQASRN